MSEIVPPEAIAGRIYSIRGQKVMLDRDLAALYRVATRVLNQVVSRNLERFPGDFMFELSRAEITGISQFVISSNIKYSNGTRGRPPAQDRLHGPGETASFLPRLRVI
jgi:hypothetical protein